jgi:hypothetical protein
VPEGKKYFNDLVTNCGYTASNDRMTVNNVLVIISRKVVAERKISLGRLGEDGRILLKCMSNKSARRAWTALTWLKIETGGRLC